MRNNALEQIVKQLSRKRTFKRIIALMSVAVILVTFNSTKFMADTLERYSDCGYDYDHQHGPECYDASGELVCQLHVHTDACYQTRPVSEPVEATVEAPVEEAAELADLPVEEDASASVEEAVPASVGETVSEQVEEAVEEVEIELDDEAEEAEDESQFYDEEFSETEPEAVEPEHIDDDAAPETQLLYYVGDQYPFFLSDVLSACAVDVPLAEVVEIGQVLSADDAPQTLSFERIEDDYAIYTVEDCEDQELAIITETDLVTVRLIEAVVPQWVKEQAEEQTEEQTGEGEQTAVTEEQPAEEEVVAETVEADNTIEEISAAEEPAVIEETAETEADIVTEDTEEPVESEEAEKVEDDTVTEDVEEPIKPEEVEEVEEAVAASEIEETEMIEDAGEAVETEEPEDDEVSAEIEEPEDDKESAEAEESEDGEEAAETEESEDGEKPAEPEAPEDSEKSDVTEEPEETEEPKDGEEATETEESEDGEESTETEDPEDDEESAETEEPKDDEASAGREESENGEESAGAEEPEDDKESAGAEESEDGEKPVETEEPENDEESAETEESEDDKESAEAEESEDGEKSAETEVPEDGEEANVSDNHSLIIDLSQVESYPLSMNAMLAHFQPVEAAPAETTPTEADPVEAEADDALTEDVEVESEAVEADVNEVEFELGEEPEAAGSVEPVELVEDTSAQPVLAYDNMLLVIEPSEDDYLITPIASFERTDIVVDDTWTILLLNSSVENAVAPMPAQSFEGETDYVSVKVEAPEGAFPAETTMSLADIDDEDTLTGIGDAVAGEDFVEVQRVHAVDITFRDAEGNEIEPLIPISVVMSIHETDADEDTVVVHMDDEGNAEVVPDVVSAAEETDEAIVEAQPVDEPVESVSFESDAFSVYAVVVTKKLETKFITAGDETYKITVTYTEDAAIPEGAALDVREIEGDEAEEYLTQAGNAVEDGRQIKLARFFDIRIMDGETEVQPAAPVMVTAELVNDAETDLSAAEPCAVHFTDEEPEVVKANEADDAVSFRAEGFSVWGVVYTVDFHWEVNGKVYDFSIPGGGYVSLEKIMEVLGVAGRDEQGDSEETQETEADTALALDNVQVSEATKQFVEDVKIVEFSSPELVWVGKAGETTTVGTLKEINGLDCEYSAKLTEEQIAEINAQTVEAGDWALISVQPFESEETLTVTMKNGDQFVVRVTDGQEPTGIEDIDEDGFYVLYVDQYYNNAHHYYALRNDGESVAVPNNDLDALGNEYTWRFGYDGTACWWYNGSKYIEPEWSTVVGDNPDGKYLWIEKRGNGFGIHGNYWSNNYLSWDSSNGFKIVRTGFDVPIKIYEKDKPQLNFSVAVNNPEYGSVSCSNTVTDLDWKNTAPIVATPAEGCYFVGWRRGDDALTGYDSTIPVGGIEFTQDNQVLTAVFGKNYTSPATQEINEWVDSLLGNPLESDKTAHVVDYDNRIYEVDLSASSSRYTIDQDIRIEFITDISRSMYFPETLLNEQDFMVNGQINLGQWLLDNGDRDKVYYVIGDINNTATMYAVYFSGNDYFTRWSIVDASYYLPYDNASTSGRIKTVCEVSNGRATINMTDRYDGNDNRIFTGKIYNSTPKPPKDTADWDRLSYLTAAVNAVSRAIYRLDPGAQIGLVTFASAASGGTLYGADDEKTFIDALHNIQPTGGTNQTAAFNLINNSNPPIFTTNSGKRQVALLITDGAPQGTTWDAIERAAGITEGKDVEIWTLGLALDRVGNNKQKLMNLASDGGYSGNAEDPDQLVTETKKILQKMLVKAAVIGEVYDTIDPAFYPVDSSGNPIIEGYYYADTTGGSVTRHSSAPSDVKKAYYHWVNDNGTWSVAYYNQEIKWPDDGGWNESFYIKAKEDFMGGNTISTNSGFDNRVEANRVKHSGNPEGYYWLKQDHSSFRVDYETPSVNVDELSLTENSTEWTVYLGTEVDPAEELRKLWNEIQVNQVVKSNGLEDEVITISQGSQMFYSDDLLNDASAPDGTSNETLPLSSIINADLIETLIRQIENGQTTASSYLSYRYFPYGHSIVGKFELSLEKKVNQAAAEDDAPNQHETKETGQEKELYTLKVRYIPEDDNASERYEHTTPGKSAGKIAEGEDGTTGELIDSENTHKIHVYAETIEVEKLRPTGEDTTETLTVPAKFGIYRKWKETDGEGSKKSLAGYKLGTNTLPAPSSDDDYYFLVEEQTTADGFAKFTVGLSSADDPYYLAETEPPLGYQHDKALKTITIAPGPDNKTDLDGETTSVMPYNWTQGVKLSIDGTEAVYVDAEGTQLVPVVGSDARDYVLPDDETGWFRTSVLNTPVGYLRIEKQVTYNHDAPTTDAQKSALAGTYTFKIYTDQECEHAFKVDGEDLKINITISDDGTAVKSDIVELPLGVYWLKEIESTNTAVFPVSDNPMSITITDSDTEAVPLDKSFVNNYDENKDPDKIALDIEKTFTGIQKSSHIPEGFKIVLTYKVENETKTINLVKDELEVESDGAKVRWSESADGLVWHWHITSIPSDAVNFKIREEGYDIIDGYDWNGTTLDGTAITLPDTPSSDHALSVTPPVATMTDVTEDRIEPDNDKNYKVYDTDVILISLTGQHGEHGTLVVSQKSLNTKQRDAITAKVPNLQGSWKTPCYFFSAEEHPEGFYYKSKDVTFTWDETKGCYIVHVEHKQSSMEEVYLVTYDNQESINNADLVNDYVEVSITIDIVKEAVNTGEKLSGAVFTLRQIKDAEPGNGGTYVSEDGTEPRTSNPTAETTGLTSFADLTHGYYELKETLAPDGYILKDSTTTYFKVEQGVVTWLIKGTGKPSTWQQKEEKGIGELVDFSAAVAADTEHDIAAQNAKFTVENEPGARLPATGGSGTTIFYAAGITLIALAAFLLLRRKERESL